MILDHVVMTMVLMPIFVIFFLIGLLLSNLNNADFFLTSNTLLLAFLFIPYIIYFAKDSFRGKSFAKRLIGLQVVDQSSGQAATALKCFIRNLTILIWPLEVVITLFSPERRLGDLIAGTRVVPAETESPGTLWNEIKKVSFTKDTVIILLIGLLYSYFLAQLMTSLIYF